MLSILICILLIYVIATIFRVIYEITLFYDDIENTTYTKDVQKEENKKLDIK